METEKIEHTPGWPCGGQIKCPACCQRTETNDGPRHRADRPEREEAPSTTAVRLYVNPNATCTGSYGGKHHVRPCPQHHPGSYARMAPRRWKHRQGVAS